MEKKLFVGNLPWGVDEKRLRDFVAEQGQAPERVEVVLDRETRRSRGFGFLHFATEEAAADARRELDGVELDGRVVHVEEATSGGGRGGGGRRQGGGSRRDERDDDRRGRDRRRDW